MCLGTLNICVHCAILVLYSVVIDVAGHLDEEDFLTC